MKKSFRFVFLLTITSLMTATAAIAANISWDGGANTNNWSDALNWSGNVVPTASDVVTIGSSGNLKTVSVTGAQVASRITCYCNLTIETGGGTLTVSTPSGVHYNGLDLQQGTVTNNGILTISTVELPTLNIASGTTFTNGSTGTANFSHSINASIVSIGGSFINQGNTSLIGNNIGTNTWGFAFGTTGASLDNSGTLSISGTMANAMFVSGAISSSSFTNTGTCTIEGTLSGAAIRWGSSHSFTNSGTFTIDATLTGSSYSGSAISMANGTNSITNTGTMNLKANSSNGRGINFGNGGTSLDFYNEGSGSISFNCGGNEIDNTYGGTFNFYQNSSGALTTTSGDINFNRVLLTGTGTGTIQNLNISGGPLSPGASSAGCLHGSGKLTIGTATNNYTLQINGPTACTGYDAYQTDGAATLTGARFGIDFGSYVPTVGQQFQIISAASYTGTPTLTITPNTITGTYASGKLTITSAPLLPVELTSFTARPTGAAVQLDWQTASETNNEGFHIERMTGDHGKWEEIGFVPGNGTTTKAANYRFLDTKPGKSNNYYRLKQRDFDGKQEYSPVENVALDNGTVLHTYPNPVSSTIIIEAAGIEPTAVGIFTQMGQNVSAQVVFSKEGKHVTADLSALPAGGYYIKAAGGVTKVWKT